MTLPSSLDEVVHDVGQAWHDMTTQSPSLPPAQPPPLLPPEAPPADPPVPPWLPVIVCPPSQPPPTSPPGFQVWSAQVPAWAWLLFASVLLLACIGVASTVYTLRTLRQLKGVRVPNEDTLRSLQGLEQRVRKGRF